MHGVSRGLGASVWRFVDEHGVHGHDVGTSDTLHIVQHLRQTAVLDSTGSNYTGTISSQI